MIDVIQTLKNLNKEFPRFQLETLIKIVDCIVEKYEYRWYDRANTSSITWPPQPWTITCSNGDDSVQMTATRPITEQEGFIYNTTTKNHIPDKTSSHQTIISSGDLATDEDINFSSIRDASDLHEFIKVAYEASGSIKK